MELAQHEDAPEAGQLELSQKARPVVEASILVGAALKFVRAAALLFELLHPKAYHYLVELAE